MRALTLPECLYGVSPHVLQSTSAGVAVVWYRRHWYEENGRTEEMII